MGTNVGLSGEIDRGRPSRRQLLKAGGIGLAAAAFPEILINCGGSSAGGKAVTGTLSVMLNKDDQNPSGQAAIMAEMKKKFESEHPGATVSYQLMTQGASELKQIQTAAASHSGADIYALGQTFIATAYATGAFETLTDSFWNSLGGKDKFLPGGIAVGGPSKDKLIALPQSLSSALLVYNRNVYQAAGISKPPTTWTEFIDIGKELTRPSGGVWGVAMAPGDEIDPWHVLWLLTTQLGGGLMSQDGKKAQLDSDKVLQAASFYVDWMGKHRIASPQDVTHTEADQAKEFIAGHAAMYPMRFSSAFASFQTSAIADAWAVAPNPTVPYGMKSLPKGGKAAETFLGGQWWGILKYSKNKELAQDFCKVMLSDEIQYMTWKNQASLPVTNSAYRAHPEMSNGVWGTAYQSALHSYPTPFSGSWGLLETVVAQAVKPIFQQIATAGTYSPAELKANLSKANAQLQASMQGGQGG